jgi:hypothetical protein
VSQLRVRGWDCLGSFGFLGFWVVHAGDSRGEGGVDVEFFGVG